MDCRSDSEGKTNEGSGYDKRNVKDNPSSVATRQVPRGKPFYAYRFAAVVFAPALVSTSLEMTRRNTVPLGLRADEGVRPYNALSNVNGGIADLPTAARRRADEERSYATAFPEGEGNIMTALTEFCRATSKTQ